MSPNAVAATVWIAVLAVMIIWEIISLGLTSIWFCGGAIVAAIAGNADPIKALYVFIVGPLVGAALAAFTYKALESDK